mgnify:CR=1 FL=1|jgi:hypothetical protein
MNLESILVLTLGALIIVVLGAYALHLYIKLQDQKAEKKQQEQMFSAELATRRDYYRNSIRVICSAIVEEQVSLTEGAIRISMLVSQLGLAEQEINDFQVFFQLTEATSHIPILEQWKNLNKMEKLRYDQEREKLEESFKDFIEDSARRVLDGTVTADGRAFVDNVKSVEKGEAGEKDEPLFYSVGNDQKNTN